MIKNLYLLIFQTTKFDPGSNPTNPPSNADEFCQQNGPGIHPHPTDCTAFYECASWGGSEMHCAPGLEFNPEILGCDWASHAGCDHGTK